MSRHEGSAVRNAVLVVDDQEMLRTLVRIALKRRRLAVETAVDGAAAIARLRERTFRVLVLDLMMPVVSGWDVVEWLAKNPERKPHSVIVVTATERDVMHRLDPSVVNAIIFKPFDVLELVAYIAAASEVPRERRSRRVVTKN